MNTCVDCSKPIHKKSQRCYKCEAKRRQNSERSKPCKQCFTIMYRRDLNKNKGISLKQWQNKKYCSNRCRYAGMVKDADSYLFQCWYCGEHFWIAGLNISSHNRKVKKFCSREHFTAFMKLPNAHLRIAQAKDKNYKRYAIHKHIGNGQAACHIESKVGRNFKSTSDANRVTCKMCKRTIALAVKKEKQARV